MALHTPEYSRSFYPKKVYMDVDQTLAGGVVVAHMRLYNERLGLGMTADRILACESYGKTFDVEEIKAFRKIGEDDFQRVREEIRTSHEVHMNLTAIPWSVEGVRRLRVAQGAEFVGYRSVRPSELEKSRTTQQWLDLNGYPDPENTVICDTPKHKLDLILDEQKKNVGEAVLFDDSIKDLVPGLIELVEEQPMRRNLAERLVLVGFGQSAAKLVPTLAPELKERTGAILIGMPSWEESQLTDVMKQLGVRDRSRLLHGPLGRTQATAY